MRKLIGAGIASLTIFANTLCNCWAFDLGNGDSVNTDVSGSTVSVTAEVSGSSTVSSGGSGGGAGYSGSGGAVATSNNGGAGGVVGYLPPRPDGYKTFRPAGFMYRNAGIDSPADFGVNCYIYPEAEVCQNETEETEPTTTSTDSDAPQIDVRAWAAYAAANMTMPVNNLVFGPEPEVNEWNMIPVNYPLWFWTENQNPTSETFTQNGITSEIKAEWAGLVVDTGEGEETCDSTTIRSDPLKQTGASPDCGHVYEKHGDYTLTATTWWNVTWNALGQKGSLLVPSQTNRELKIGQLRSVIIDRKYGN